jgi:hypothetical protein
MNPIAIATIRDQIKRLETQAEQLSQEHPRTADQLRESAQQLYGAIVPYCFGCGILLSPIDPGDHLCFSCLGAALLSFGGAI